MFTGSGDASSSVLSHKDKLSQRIHHALKPYESPILNFQRLLVWDNPMYSTLFVFIFHLGLWYLWANSDHAFSIFFSFILILVWVDFCKQKIWPQVPTVASDNDLEWGELDPQLFSLKEMSDILARVYLYLQRSYQTMLIARADHHGKFSIICGAVCVAMVIIGQRIHGAFLCYTLILCLLVWPLLWYHRCLEKSYSILGPYFMQMQYMLQQKPSDTYQIAKAMASQASFDKRDDSDDDLTEFLPNFDEKSATLLAKAVVDTETSETDEETLSQELPTFSGASTLDHTKFNQPLVDPVSQELRNLTEHSDHEDDNFGIPLPYQAESGTQMTSLLQQLPINADVIGSAVSNIVKDTFSSVAKTMQFPNTQTDGPDSTSSTPVSDYEFIDFVTDEESI